MSKVNVDFRSEVLSNVGADNGGFVNASVRDSGFGMDKVGGLQLDRVQAILEVSSRSNFVRLPVNEFADATFEYDGVAVLVDAFDGD